jgi:peptidoglycan/xylan/chitin deacetylase (PgdA/CDA1 family)
MTKYLLVVAAVAGCSLHPPAIILTYHSIGGTGHFAVDEARFAAELDFLQGRGFETVTVRELAAHVRSGAPLPKKPIALSFDDGLEDAYTRALPMLRARGMRATFFVSSALVGATAAGRLSDESGRHLVWPEVLALAQAGMEIGAHGRTHAHLERLGEPRAREEIVGSKRDLENALGRPIVSMSYPYNAVRAGLRDMVREAGYWVACAGGIHGSGDLFSLRRTGVYAGETIEQFAQATQ